MNAKHIIGIMFLATGLMVGGCGGMEVDTDPHDESTSRQDAIWWICEVGVSWRIEYFSDASRTQWVGAYDCTCGELAVIGERTAYSTSTPPQFCY